ncbi:MAG: GNAT family N-acetyltransferase [Rhodospirillales bacterium RIFCSPLOWO2_12_FULL_67_15]|nr:MAG: GNAT family N-acetyltransferase [Rhodospirillales bacterium RIFCSPLOWO2_12_FULL_67_15]
MSDNAMTMVYARESALDPEEFTDVLRRSGLAARRQVDEPDRIRAMARNANLTLTARDSGGGLIGVARSLTDFAYCCYLSDLAVDAAWQRRGIGRELIRRTREAAGPGATLLLLSAPNAMDYYRRIGMAKIENGFAFARER